MKWQCTRLSRKDMGCGRWCYSPGHPEHPGHPASDTTNASRCPQQGRHWEKTEPPLILAILHILAILLQTPTPAAPDGALYPGHPEHPGHPAADTTNASRCPQQGRHQTRTEPLLSWPSRTVNPASDTYTSRVSGCYHPGHPGHPGHPASDAHRHPTSNPASD